LSTRARENKISTQEEIEWTSAEIARLVATGAVKEVPRAELREVSPIRLAPKKGPKKFVDCQHEKAQQVITCSSFSDGGVGDYSRSLWGFASWAIDTWKYPSLRSHVTKESPGLDNASGRAGITPTRFSPLAALSA